MEEPCVADEIAVLIVEDEDAVRLTLRDYLTKSGFNVFVASDGAGAIEQMLDHDIDVIVSDYRMNILGGHYWIRFLQRYCPEQKVIITSAYLDGNVEIPYPILRKPFDFAELAQRIKAQISA